MASSIFTNRARKRAEFASHCRACRSIIVAARTANFSLPTRLTIGILSNSKRTYITTTINSSIPTIRPSGRTRTPLWWQGFGEQSKRKRASSILAAVTTCFAGYYENAGFPVAVTYDPMVPTYAARPEGKYDLVTSFETFEHLPDPAAGIASILEFAAEPGLIFFSTLLQPADFDQQGLNWWYVGPRNGHVSLFSRQALQTAWGRHGYKVASLADNIHFAFRTLPAFLAHLQK